MTDSRRRVKSVTTSLAALFIQAFLCREPSSIASSITISRVPIVSTVVNMPHLLSWTPSFCGLHQTWPELTREHLYYTTIFMFGLQLKNMFTTLKCPISNSNGVSVKENSDLQYWHSVGYINITFRVENSKLENSNSSQTCVSSWREGNINVWKQYKMDT